MRNAILILLILLAPFAFCQEETSQAEYNAAQNENGNNPLFELVDIAVVGAGWGGTYAGWRLAKAFPSQKVRMYEKQNRIGGRAFFVDETYAPELNGLEENMGGYRWNNKEQVFVDSLTQHLGIPTRCWSISNYINQTTNCNTLSNAPEPLYSYNRGRLMTSAQQGNSSNWIYHNLEGMTWSSLAARPNPTRVATGIAFPFLSTAVYPNLQSCNDTARWEAVKQVTDRIKACNVGDCFVPGQNPNNVPIKYFVQNLYPEDFFALDDVVGTSLSFLSRVRYQSSIYSAGVSQAISFGTTGCGGAGPFQTVLEGGGRKGYATGPHIMVAQGAAAQGVSQSTFLKFNYQLYTIRKVLNRYSLKFTNGKTVLAKKVILNIGVFNYQRHLDKHDNILFDNAMPNLKSIYALSDITGAKTWLLYEPAWWIQAGLFQGSVQTDETFKFMRFHQGHVICSNSSTSSCRGLFLASYQILHVHEHKSLDWQNQGPDESSNLYVARRSNPRDAYILDLLHARLMKIMGAGIINNTASIAPPTLALFVNWFEDPWNRCGTYAATTSVTPGTQEARAMKPLDNEDIYIAQIDWMLTINSYAEAPLIMAERVANQYFGLSQPSWLPTVWYNYMIKTLRM